ncbi:MAG TPA: bifunctional diaminohydroxyphosphoribosylaminopyrimidine deaminase/5-amino-6-(5-phosphoribosylamino)uracil reductase RibD [Mycobacteriales bacterium]
MDDVEAMRRAVALSRLGLGRTAPNPTVGCVLVAPDGEVVGEGFHVYADRDHAEVVALRAAGPRARGATAYTTLSPCERPGRTGACADALRDAGVARVVWAVADPTQPPTVGEQGPLAGEAALVNEAWLLAVRERRPFVTWKYAASLDGRVAAADGTSQWITGADARADVHRLRAECDAIAVGISTVLADDPHLTVRAPDGTLAARQPLRVVVDSTFRVPPGARVLDGAAPTLVATTVAPADAKVEAVVLPRAADGHTDVPALLAHLYERGVRHLFVEGGPKLAGTLVDAGLVDRVVGYVAPLALGAGRPLLDNAGAPTLAAAPRFRLDDVTRVGDDVRLTWRRA